MATFIFVVEIITVNFNQPFEIDVEHDTREVDAIDEEMALAELKESICYRTEFDARDITNIKCLGELT